ncbi:gp476 [Bacillus phage G]|uniref:Gp476 n=1 Tax=Bacillus phage G TaxID=2884420 RepID=G3MAL7_9CAUD|nr:gp476 [Bacillus phage G]AEO93734.1 gp476 [Bacillus phage G]
MKVELVSLALVKEIYIKENSNLIDVYDSNDWRIFAIYYDKQADLYIVRTIMKWKRKEWMRNTVIISKTADIEETLRNSKRAIRALM